MLVWVNHQSIALRSAYNEKVYYNYKWQTNISDKIFPWLTLGTHVQEGYGSVTMLAVRNLADRDVIEI